MEKIRIMVNGLPGNMAFNVVRHAARDERFQLIPCSLTGPEISDTQFEGAGQTLALISPQKRAEAITKIKQQHAPFISVDFTHPTAVLENATFYCQQKLPFVMGTTGGDRQKLEERVRASDTVAVIAPNMAKQIVGFQAMMAYAAENFPGLFAGYTLEIKESHQKGKADTSGTAKAMVNYFNGFGIPFKESGIIKERDPEIQKKAWGVPKPFLAGHAYHTYTLESADKTARFQFTHNINGRDIYALGTLDAILYLHAKIGAGVRGAVFSMIDVMMGK